MTDKFFATNKGDIYEITKSDNKQVFVKQIGKNKDLGNMVKSLGSDHMIGHLIPTDKKDIFILEI